MERADVGDRRCALETKVPTRLGRGATGVHSNRLRLCSEIKKCCTAPHASNSLRIYKQAKLSHCTASSLRDKAINSNYMTEVNASPLILERIL